MSVDPELIRAEAHTEVGQVIQRDASILIERWRRRAVQEQPQARRVHHEALLDHLQELPQALGRSLAESDDLAANQHWLPATIHGADRWEVGWSLLEVVRDYQILRLVILDYLEEALDEPLESRVVMAIGLALDEAIAASVDRYVASRDRYLRQLEDERAERDKQIQEHLLQKAEALREVDRRKNEFLAILGHELRNPLAPLWNAVKVLEAHKTPEAAGQAVLRIRDILKRQVQQLSRLADDLLDISRIAQNKVELRKTPVDLGTVVGQAVQMSMPHLNARRHNFEMVLPEKPVWVEADAERLTQIVVNLLNNAAKYTEPRGQIVLQAGCEGGEAVICVRDNGIGIPPETLPHIFELFTQGEWSVDPSQGGMGIGLALVRRLVELHGGVLSAHSDGIGRGSEFVVRLRALPGDGAAEQSRRQDGESLSAVECPRRRVLVVDDNVDAAESLGMLLSLDGHEVQVAYDGVMALQAAETFQPEVVLLDIGLPRLDGHEVARRLRQNPALKGVLVVALTGYGQDVDRRRSQEAGCNAHLIKPVDLSALRTLLAEYESLLHGQAKV